MPPGSASLPDDHLLGSAGFRIDLLDAVVGHVGDEDAVLVVDREIVERGLELGDHLLGAGLRIDPHQLAERGIDHPEIALGIEIDRGRNLEAVGDHGEFGLVDVDLGDLALEPQRAVQHVVGSEFEAVEAAHLLHDLARRFYALDVDLIERVAEEHLRRVQPSVLAERERVDAGQAGGEFLHRAVALARIEIAGEEGRPRHGAVGRKRDVVGHAFRGGDRNLRRAVTAIDLVERGACDAAGEQAAGLVDPEPVHAMKRRSRNQLGNLVGLRRCAGRVSKNDRRNSRCECEPARHDASSQGFLWEAVFVAAGGLANETVGRLRGRRHKSDTQHEKPRPMLKILSKTQRLRFSGSPGASAARRRRLRRHGPHCRGCSSAYRGGHALFRSSSSLCLRASARAAA